MIRSLFRMLKHISLAVLAIVAAVCIAEVGLRVQRLYEEVDVAGGICELTPRPCPITFQELPPLQQFIRQNPETGEPVEIRTNVLGLRGPQVAVPKSTAVVRIVCLGDDATFAGDINEQATFCRLVEQSLSQQNATTVEVINAGIPGYCPLLSLAWARQRLAGLQPDLVVLCCDRSDILDDRRVRPLASYTSDGTLHAVCHPAAASRPKCLVQGIEQEFLLASLMRKQLGNYVGMNLDADLPADWAEAPSTEGGGDLQTRQTWEPIVALRDLCTQISADFVVAVVPSRGTESGTASNQSFPLLEQVADEAGIPYLDVSADFPPQAAPPLFAAETGALSPAGHQRFAELLSWAIQHRSGVAHPSGEPTSPAAPAVDITPTSATQPSPRETSITPSPDTQSPAPLPQRRRRRVEDDTPEWAQ